MSRRRRQAPAALLRSRFGRFAVTASKLMQTCGLSRAQGVKAAKRRR
jgi:hypothetical protein